MRAEPRIIELDFNEKKLKASFTQLKPSDSLIFLMFLGKIVGGSAGKFISATDGKSLTELVDKSNFGEFNSDKIGDAISGFFERIGEEDTIKKLNLLLKSVTIEGEEAYLDHPVFMGNLNQLFKVLKISLEVNYQGFFNASSGILKRFQNLKEILKNTPN